MNLTWLSLVAFVAFFASFVAAEPGFKYANMAGNRLHRRGFKSSLLSTARGFGKRSSSEGVVVEEEQQQPLEDSAAIPVYLLAEEASANPRLLMRLAAALDLDEDGRISAQELKRIY